MGQLVVNIGDLYYVPQNVTMLQFNENEHNDAVVPVGYYKTVKPTKVVVVKKRPNDIIEVLYNGQKWDVDQRNLYLLEKKCPS